MSPNVNTDNDAKASRAQTATPNPSLCRSPQRTTNNYASAKTPIMSAKRPKKWSSIPTPYSTPINSTPTALTRNIIRAPETSTQTIRKNHKLYPTLSPMHNAKPVARDSHLAASVAIAAPVYSAGNHVTELSIGTDLCTHTANEDGDGESPASASWVGRKVDAIFSPVLSFLQGATNGTASDGEGNMGRGRAQPNDLEEESGSCTIECSRNHVRVVRDDLREAKSDSQKDDCSSCHKHTKQKPASYDDIPTMTNTESSGSHVVDVDGDVTMADYNQLPYSEDVSANQNYSDLSAHDDEDEFNPYLFIKCLPPYLHAIPPGWTSRPKALPPLDITVPPSIPPICLVLDLDETLVHCTVEPVSDADMIFPVEFNGTEYQVHVRCRPFLREFLEAVSRKFEVVIFTASQQVYADKLLDKIDPEGKFIRHRMFRDSCLPVEGNFLKDLTILGRDLSKAVLVDNSPHAFGYQVDNGIPIESWFDDPTDKELLKLEIFLRTLHGVDDVRDVVRKTFQTHQLVLNA